VLYLHIYGEDVAAAKLPMRDEFDLARIDVDVLVEMEPGARTGSSVADFLRPQFSPLRRDRLTKIPQAQ
jgi:hypothetical protein